MFVRGITLSLAALLAAGSMVESALADHKRRHVIIEDDYYEGRPSSVTFRACVSSSATMR